MMMFAVALAIVAFGLQVAELIQSQGGARHYTQRKKRKAPTAAREADQSAR